MSMVLTQVDVSVMSVAAARISELDFCASSSAAFNKVPTLTVRLSDSRLRRRRYVRITGSSSMALRSL